MKPNDKNQTFISKVLQFINEEIYEFTGQKKKESHKEELNLEIDTEETQEKSFLELVDKDTPQKELDDFGLDSEPKDSLVENKNEVETQRKPEKELDDFPDEHSLKKTDEANADESKDETNTIGLTSEIKEVKPEDFQHLEESNTKVFNPKDFPHLVLVKGFLPEREFNLIDNETTFGRSTANTIVLADKSASRNHAKIVRKEEGFVIYDLESTNGVIINGEQVQQAKLINHDIITIGEFSFEFIMSEEASPLPSLPHVLEIGESEADEELISIGEKKPGILERLIPKGKRRRIFILIGFFVIAVIFLRNLMSEKTDIVPHQEEPTNELSRASEKRFQFSFAEGKDLLEKEQYEEALQAFNVALKLDPTNEEVLRYKKRTEGAIELAKEMKQERQATQKEEERALTIERLEREGMNFYNQYNYEKARESFGELEKVDPGNEIAKKYLALINEITSSAYKDKLKTQEEETLVKEQVELAQSLYDQGDKYRAILEMRKVFNFEVDLSESRDKIQSRIEIWEKELRDKLKEKLQHAKSLWENGEKKEARNLLKEILAEYPDYTEAKEELDRIDESLKEETSKYFNEGRIYEYNDDIDAAIENYEKVINLLDRDDEYYKKAEDQLRKIR